MSRIKEKTWQVTTKDGNVHLVTSVLKPRGNGIQGVKEVKGYFPDSDTAGVQSWGDFLRQQSSRDEQQTRRKIRSFVINLTLILSAVGLASQVPKLWSAFIQHQEQSATQIASSTQAAAESTLSAATVQALIRQAEATEQELSAQATETQQANVISTLQAEATQEVIEEFERRTIIEKMINAATADVYLLFPDGGEQKLSCHAFKGSIRMPDGTNQEVWVGAEYSLGAFFPSFNKESAHLISGVRFQSIENIGTEPRAETYTLGEDIIFAEVGPAGQIIAVFKNKSPSASDFKAIPLILEEYSGPGYTIQHDESATTFDGLKLYPLSPEHTTAFSSKGGNIRYWEIPDLDSRLFQSGGDPIVGISADASYGAVGTTGFVYGPYQMVYPNTAGLEHPINMYQELVKQMNEALGSIKLFGQP